MPVLVRRSFDIAAAMREDAGRKRRDSSTTVPQVQVQVQVQVSASESIKVG
jgi:hypothetical protein